MSSNVTYTPIPEGMAATPANFNSRFSSIVESFNSTLILGDTSNADVTFGVTINQAANTDQFLAVKSSQVSHGLTSFAETDTFLAAIRHTDATGGFALRGLAEDAAQTVVVEVLALGGTADTTKSTAGKGLIDLVAIEHDGANALANVTADGNIVSMRARVGGSNLARWLVDEDGDTWQSGGITIPITGVINWSGGASIEGASGSLTLSCPDVYVSDALTLSGGNLTIGAAGTTGGSLRPAADKLALHNDNGDVCMAVGAASGAAAVGFYTTTPIAKQTGVAVSAAGIHAALVALGLISA